MCLLALIVCSLLDASRPAHALDPARLLSQYGHTAWRLQDGDLPGPAFPIAQSSDGYLWIGTRVGVVRFDGVRFVRLEELTATPPTDAFIVSMLGASDGSLWIGTSTSLSRWHQGRISHYPDLSGGASAISEDENGKIWFLTFSETAQPLCEIAENRAVCHGKESGLDLPSHCCVPSMLTDRLGTFWINNTTAVVRWRQGTQSEAFPLPARIASGVPGFLVFAPDAAGALWVGVPARGAGLGLQRLVDNTLQQFVTAQVDGSTLAPQALLRDRQGALWVGTLDRGIYRILPNRVDHFDSRDGLSSDCIYSFFEDRAGNLWVATSKGIDRLRDLRVASFSTREGVSVDEVDSVLAARDGKIWMGTAGGLDVLEHGRVRSIRAGRGLPGNQVTSLLEDDAGRLWVGIDNTLAIYASGKFSTVPSREGGPLGLVGGLTQDTQGNIWAALRTTPRKLVRIKDRKVLDEFEEPAHPPVASLAADPKEGIWLGLRNGALAHLRPSGMATFASDLSGTPVRRVIVTSGAVYGATDKGLVALKDGVVRVWTSKDGLPCDEVYGLIEAKDGALWLHMGCGLVRLVPDEIDRRWRNSSHLLHPEVFDVLDGVRLGRAPFDNAVRAPDGTLWFANGVAVQTLDPHRVRSSVTPALYIEQIIADRKRHSFLEPITLPALTRDVQIDYTALELAVPQRLRFRYRLEGHDQEWTDAQTRRQAFYTDLPPGDYRFSVAVNQGGDVWSPSPASVQFAVLPAFYQTGWFKSLAVATAAAALWLAFTWRIAQVKIQMRARLDGRLTERERIARELHDTFLQGVHGLMLKFQVAMEKIPPSQPARELMENALDHADAVFAEGRERVTQLRTLQQSASDLVNTLQMLGEDLARNGPVAFNLTVAGVRQELDPVVSDEVQCILGEALANAFRHANARQIDVDVAYTRKQLAVSVVDDGRGFDVGAVEEQPQVGHWGLKGMQERATKIRAQLEVSSRRELGTAVELKVPAAIAFRRSERRWRQWLNLLRTRASLRASNAPGARNDQPTQ